MRIASGSLSLDAQHASQQSWALQENLDIRVSQNTGATANTAGTSAAPLTSSLVAISSAGSARQSSETNAVRQGLDAAERDPMLQLLRAIIALLTGHEAKVFDASSLAQGSAASSTDTTTPTTSQVSSPSPSAPAISLDYTRTESYTEVEQTSFNASGSIRTADGQTLQFSLSLDMSRVYHEESSTHIQIGNAARTQDPLVLNFAGTAAQLSSQRFQFDLNADGQNESINFAGPGSGFLAIDRNGDGVINNGSELFGAQSGKGFADLAILDADHNGWIDENDPAYEQLRVWTKDANGNDQLGTLKQAGVGALNLANTATPFALKDANNELLGQIVSSGVFLNENGSVGTIQQVDLTV
ncbi:hypothetical protein [Propionivibrio dicarboxylicus]|uniref:VCBS repeat-containing protein n=1 Tax=Propionivibrio dicarboxylicus TaxID=83767 RepID=A0A1G7XMF9_9RHOO|nr:hypothetical protein [Propionivibrio dicarboxylicus]SDG85223.1 hypothetical protein SAMN05660652_00731 [Propionivibrio dicarboxylicus]